MPTPPGVLVRPLTTHVPVPNLAGPRGSEQYFRLGIPAGPHTVQVAVSGGSGDVDLYVRLGRLPTRHSYDARPARVGNQETVSVTVADTRLVTGFDRTAVVSRTAGGVGRWRFLAGVAAVECFVMLLGYRAYAGVTLEAAYL